MDMEQLAAYLRRDIREVGKLASRGHLPGHKVGGQWRFARAEINQWIETQMSSLTEKQLTNLEATGPRGGDAEPLVTNLLSESSIAVPLVASSRASVLKELVTLAEQSWQVYDPQAILDAVRQREEMASTALPSGIAIPHPRHPIILPLGRTFLHLCLLERPIDFGAPDKQKVHTLFILICPTIRIHLQMLARIARLLRDDTFQAILNQRSPAQIILDQVRRMEEQLE